MRKLVMCAIIGVLLAPLGVSAQAELTANAGYLSQYYYRGFLQKTSSANGGFDVAASNFSAGTWAADVGDGSEVDLYASVGIPLGEMASASIGGTGYFYTGQFDDTYLEANVGVAVGPLSLDAAFGTYDDGNDTKYVFIGVTGTADNGLFATAGTIAFHTALCDAFSDAFDNEAAAMYLEGGYGFSAADLDLTISGIWNNANASGEFSDRNGDGIQDANEASRTELTLVFGVSKTFTIPTG